MAIHRACAWLVVALCGAAPAHASCPITLDGDADAVAWVRGELAAFAVSDDGNCLALRVVCRARDGALELELHDELGRSVVRQFASPEGAASFLVSWSRRPLVPVPVVAAAVAATPARVEHAAVSPARRRRWPEVGLAYVGVPGEISPHWGALTVALSNRDTGWRYGAAVRGLVGGRYAIDTGLSHHRAVVAGEAEAMVGFGHALDTKLVFRGELAAGASVIAAVARPLGLEYRGSGVRGSARALLLAKPTAALAFEIGAGVETLYLLDEWDIGAENGSMLFAPYGHVGIRWTP